jgi:putative alpha-1,2-mannosidase
VYFAIETSVPLKNYGVELDGKRLAPDASEVRGKNIRGQFEFQLPPGGQLLLRVGLSPTSVEAARQNLKTEMDSWDFDGVRAAAGRRWNEALSRIRIESSNPQIRQTFYSAAYHTLTEPVLYNNADGSYPGPDGKIHAGEGFQYYSTFSLWDTFRAEHPLLTLTQPERVDDFIRTLLAFYQQSPERLLPLWPLAGIETGQQEGPGQPRVVSLEGGIGRVRHGGRSGGLGTGGIGGVARPGRLGLRRARWRPGHERNWKPRRPGDQQPPPPGWRG